MMKKIIINYKNMNNYTVIPTEYRFVDKVEVLPGVEAKGEKLVSFQEHHFKEQAEMRPFMHRAFVMEAVMQTGTFILTTMPEIGNKLLIFNSCESAEMMGHVYLGDVLDTEVSLLSYRHGIAKMRGYGGVNGHPVISMEYTLVLQEGMVKMSVNTST